jgi:energy-coupling factor transport system substrate-specific component
MSSVSPAAVIPDTRWRTRDIVVTAVIGVAFGVVFWAWGLAWAPIEAALGPARFLLYAVWLVPAVLAPLIVRKPGAALFAEMLAAAVATLIGSQWGPDTLLSGFVQGAAAEAIAAWVHDWVLYFPELDLGTMVLFGILMAISAVVIVAGGSLFLVRALRQAGVLEGFPGGEA